MPFKIGWLDEQLHIYDIVLTDPFTITDQDRFFKEFFCFVDVASAPLYGLFDVSGWSQSGAAGLGDPRFKQMGNYRKKIVVVVMVTRSTAAAAMAKLGAVVVGHRDWLCFEKSRDTAVQYLRERAIAAIGPPYRMSH